MSPTRAAARTDDGAAAPADRAALRQRLIADRTRFAGEARAAAAQAALTAHLARLLRELEPTLLGLYWPVRGEFNACAAWAPATRAATATALPYARRTPHEMHYRAWDGETPAGIDECGLPAPAAGPAVVPDVVLVPCVGFTRSGWRLGYGGGYFDRWLALHPHVTAVGVAWSGGEIAERDWAVQAHDRPLALVVTENGVVA